MKKKILFLFVHLDYGGAEVGLLTTLKNIDRARFDCSIVSMEKKGAVAVEIEALGYKVYYLNQVARLFNLRLLGRILNILKKEKPDILHTSLFYANFFGRVAAILAGKPLVITEERSMYTEKRFYHVFLDRILSLFTHKIIVCSRSVLDFTVKQEGIDPGKFCLIYNAVDADRFNVAETKTELRERYGFAENDFIVGAVGSLIPKKGHKFLIEAAADLVKDIPRLKLLIVGEGKERAGLSDFARSKGIGGNVVFLGGRKDIPELMKTMDIFALPSLQEGFPRTLIEAMYVGLPVVASNISGVPEVVREGRDGFLVSPGDVHAIKKRISALYKDTNLREGVGQNARKKIESGYLPGHYISKLEELYSVTT